MRLAAILAPALYLVVSPGVERASAGSPTPKVAEGWSIALVAEAPAIAYPTACVVARDGTIFLGQDPMDMPGPPTRPLDSVVAIKGGKVTTFASGLWAVMGLEWSEGTLYVVHAPYLSAFRDRDGDGRADSRVDLVTGLGPMPPGFNGINDHIASGIRLGADGFLYIAVGDKGIPKGVGRDGATVTMSSGGVIRVRPDGSGLEVVSTGERNPLSVALTRRDDVFTYGNDDDAKAWPNTLTHHVDGGHYGYPYEFLAAPSRALPFVEGQFGGAGAQGISYDEDGLPARFRGGLFFCDWGRQAVFRVQVAPEGGTFRVAGRETIVEKGDLADFRPFSIAVGADGSELYVVDWAFNGWLSDGPKTGRLFRLTYTGADRVRPAPRTGDPIRDLDHPARAVRLDAQRALARSKDVDGLAVRLRDREGEDGRFHALWALDAIGTPEARRVVRSSLVDPNPSVRLQAARSSGIRRDREASPGLSALLRDPEPAVRREAAIALGRVGDLSSVPGLYAALGDPDAFASWSIRKAIRRMGGYDVDRLSAALADPKRREDALKLADESWNVASVRALADASRRSDDPGFRARAVMALSGLYRKPAEWSGRWFGTNPLAAPAPPRAVDWDREGMDAVFRGLAGALSDPDPGVRRPAIFGLIGVGERGSARLRAALAREADPTDLALIAAGLGSLRDPGSIPGLAALVTDPGRPIEARASALRALGAIGGAKSLNALLTIAYDPKAPESLVAPALATLGRGRSLPANDLLGFLDHASASVRAAALDAIPPATRRPLPTEVRSAILARLDDPAPEVRLAAIRAVATHQIREAIPRLVALAADEGSRVEATRALVAMPDPRGLPAYVAGLGDRDPRARQLAESALVAIRDQVSGDLESLAKRGKFVGPSALAVERILSRFEVVDGWRVIGPFPRTTAPLFADSAAIDFRAPKVGAEGRPVAWQGRTADPKTGLVSIEDLKQAAGDRGAVLAGFGFDDAGSADLAAFAYAEVASDRDRVAWLSAEASGPIWVAVNDRPAIAPGNPDPHSARVALKAGTNRLLALTRQGAGPWAFGLRVSEGSPIAPALASGSAHREGLRAFAMAERRGDPRNGEALFRDPKGLACARCHVVGGDSPSPLGPDLAGLARKYDKAEIVRSVLEPSSRIATGFRPVAIARKDGTVATGLLRFEGDDRIELIDAEGRPIRVARSEVESRSLLDASIMPDGLADALSPVEFADLIAFLSGLK